MVSRGSRYFKNERIDLLEMVPREAKTILDLGCGEGCAGSKIKERDPGAKVYGVEIDEASGRKAELVLDGVIIGDLEKADLPFEKKYFDCIVAADVLEHLVDPWNTLKKIRELLADDGVLVVSIPNIRYYKAIIRLVLGYWDYSGRGIFDISHLRFFCLVNIREMLMDPGFEIVSIKRNIVAARGFRFLNFLLLGRLRDLLTYQYYIKARRVNKVGPAGQKRKIFEF